MPAPKKTARTTRTVRALTRRGATSASAAADSFIRGMGFPSLYKAPPARRRRPLPLPRAREGARTGDCCIGGNRFQLAPWRLQSALGMARNLVADVFHTPGNPPVNHCCERPQKTKRKNVHGLLIVVNILIHALARTARESRDFKMGSDPSSILDMLRTSVNVTGDLSCSAFIARSEGERLEPAAPEGAAATPS